MTPSSLYVWLQTWLHQLSIWVVRILPVIKHSKKCSYECTLDLEHERNMVMQSKQSRRDIQLKYDPLQCKSLENFQHLKQKSDCIFAKAAVLWGSPEYDTRLSLEVNISNCLDSITKFMSIAEETNVDGFLIEIVGEQFGKSVDSFAATVRKVLQLVSRKDPSGLCCMDMASINTPSWYFSFGGVPVFVTTFAPCYTSSHCRYMHLSDSSNSERCFILLQPEASFLRRGIGTDTPHTNWANPITPRDKIRAQFKLHGREYHVPDTTMYAVASSYVLPMNNLRGNGVRFWDEKEYPELLLRRSKSDEFQCS